MEKPLEMEQIRTLEDRDCTSSDWSKVYVAEPFDPTRFRDVSFDGKVRIGDLSGMVCDMAGLEKPCGIFHASLMDVTIGNHVRIHNVGVQISRYDIADGVCIENIGTMQTLPGATFGNGVEVRVLNEAGGREIILFNELTSQTAYLMCLHRYRPKMIEHLTSMIREYVESMRNDRGQVGTGATICATPEITNVNIGARVVVNGVNRLVNGTILSEPEVVTTIGAGVVAKNFIVGEGSTITDGVILDRVFVGQGCEIGKQFSAENSLFFANCEAFHGEAVSIFAGPYTVTHHKSTLLIAGLFSFYNAGSGTNQSNHMYKLGPCHEGKVMRGSKTGSFAYMMWPCVVGPFSVVLGKHTSTFDTGDYPFSHLEARPDGKCNLLPGLHLTTVGTVRDGIKWPKRDRRKGKKKRDLITFDVFSPYVVGKMIKAGDTLGELLEKTDKNIQEVSVGGAIVRRLLLRTARKYYRNGIEMYLLDKIVQRIEKALDSKNTKPESFFQSDPHAVYSNEWIDLGGLLMAQDRLFTLQDEIANGTIRTIEELSRAIQAIHASYAPDEWIWIRAACLKVFGIDLDRATKQDMVGILENLAKIKSKFLNLVIADAEKEFGEFSHCGFGFDGSSGEAMEDFRRVRGTYEDHFFVQEMKRQVQDVQKHIETLLTRLNECDL
ncbi:MAG: DUF4954 family protein [Sedimentisphaerales bacterium]|nr:DUF4954 family protein [Sedimentisphaerales bacterium]